MKEPLISPVTRIRLLLFMIIVMFFAGYNLIGCSTLNKRGPARYSSAYLSGEYRHKIIKDTVIMYNTHKPIKEESE